MPWTKVDRGAAMVALLLAAAPVAAQPVDDATPPAPTLEIVEPLAREVVTTDGQLRIRARVSGAEMEPGQPVTGRITARRGEAEWVLAEGDLRSGEEMNPLGMVWNVADVPPGEIELHIEVTGTPGPLEASAPLLVRRPPVIRSVELVDLRLTDQGVEARLQADAGTEDGVPIVRYQWTPDSGLDTRVTDGPTARLTYPSFGGVRFVILEAFDAMGGVARSQHRLTMPGDRVLLEAKLSECRLLDACLEFFGDLFERIFPSCGCDRMILTDQSTGVANTTGPFCMPQGQLPAAPDGCAAYPDPTLGNCPAGLVPFRCNLGRSAPGVGRTHLTYAYKIIAILEDGSDAATCDEGQYIQKTSLRNGQRRPADTTFVEPEPQAATIILPRRRGDFTFTAVEAQTGGNRTPTPEFGATAFGGDGYSRENQWAKRYRGRRVVWWDAPGLLDVNPLTDAPASYQADVIAFVAGDLGTCWCRFVIDNRYAVDGEGRDVGTGRLEVKDGLHCIRIDS